MIGASALERDCPSSLRSQDIGSWGQRKNLNRKSLFIIILIILCSLSQLELIFAVTNLVQTQLDVLVYSPAGQNVLPGSQHQAQKERKKENATQAFLFCIQKKPVDQTCRGHKNVIVQRD